MQEQYVVYIDVVFAINLVMDYVILWATGRLSQLKTTAVRLIAGSAAGAVYSLALLMPASGIWLGLPARILFSVLMLTLVFGRCPLRRLVQAMGYFYLVAFATAGAMLGAVYLFNGGMDVSSATVNGLFMFLISVRYGWLLAAIAAAVIVGRWGVQAIKRNFLNSMLQVPVIIRFGQHRLPVEALIDTGNQLKDPITQKPVMIVEYGVLKPVLPAEVYAAFEKSNDPDLQEAIKVLTGSPWASRIRMIPFTSIGRSRGMLLGFRPDEIIVVAENKLVRVTDVVIGVYQRSLTTGGNYRALLHPDILHTAISA